LSQPTTGSELIRRILWLWLAFVRSQVVLMAVVGGLTWVGLTALGVRWALLLALVAGLLEIVPNLGPVLATVPAVVVALLYGSSWFDLEKWVVALIVVSYYVLVQQLENILIVPLVMSDALKLPAWLVLAGMMVGAAVAGVPGALLATPLIATVRELVRYYNARRQGTSPQADSDTRGGRTSGPNQAA